MKYLLTSDECPHCKQAKQKFKRELDNGEIKELPIDTEEGFALVGELDVRGVPALIECEENKCRVLDINR